MSPPAVLVYEPAAGGEAWVRSVAATDPDVVGSDLRTALARLAERLAPDDTVAWHAVRQPGFDATRWSARVERPLAIRHLGFATTPEGVVRALQAVAGEDPFLVPSGRSGAPTPRLTWLLGGAGITTVRTLRQLGPIAAPTTGGIAARLARYGWRAFEHGVLAHHDPGLGAAERTDRWSGRDVRALIGHRWGATRRGPALLARLLPAPRPSAVARPDEGGFAHHDAEAPGGRDADPDTVDVVIPTLERSGPLRRVLDDLACQAPPPGRVIVLEQRPDGSASVLDHLREVAWPFALVLATSRQLGASRARNQALRHTTARWIALLDDDVRLGPGLLAAMVAEAEASGADALSIGEADADTPLTAVTPRPDGASPDAPPPRPALAVGSGRSVVRRRALYAVGGFDETLEGWGEDVDLGWRLHRAGFTVLASRRLALVHLKAPRGGFRHPRRPPWEHGLVRPLPSPLIAYRWQRHMPPVMLTGMVRAHLLRTARRRAFGPLAVPWLWLRWRASARWARRLGAPRLGLHHEETR